MGRQAKGRTWLALHETDTDTDTDTEREGIGPRVHRGSDRDLHGGRIGGWAPPKPVARRARVCWWGLGASAAVSRWGHPFPCRGSSSPSPHPPPATPNGGVPPLSS